MIKSALAFFGLPISMFLLAWAFYDFMQIVSNAVKSIA